MPRLLFVGSLATLALGLAVPASAAPVPGSVRGTPVADAYVNSLHPDAASGTARQLRVNGDPQRSKWVYVRFSVEGIPQGATITRATLRLLARTNAPGAAVAAYHVDGDDWNETTLTWRSRPPVDPTAFDTETGMAAGQWSEWEVTAVVGGNGLHSFALGRFEAVNADIDWNSRENAAGAPELLVEFTTPNPCDEPPNEIYVPSCGAWQGAAAASVGLATFENAIGRTVDVTHVFYYFDSFDTPAENFPKAAEAAAIEGGRMLLWNWKPRNGSNSVRYAWSDIARGVYDGKIDATADKVAEWAVAHPGRKTFMAFHHEPEDQVGGEYGSAADYVAAYRRVRDRFAAKGVDEAVIWVWIMTGYKARVKQWNELYPGDDYVDWLGYDPYAGLCTESGPPPSFDRAMGQGTGPEPDDSGNYRFYKWATGTGAVDAQDGQLYVKPGAHDKPVLWGEYATKMNHGGSDDDGQAFFRTMKTRVTEEGRFPQVKAFLHWQKGRECHDFTASAPLTRDAYRAMIASPHFNAVKPY
jgi:hypothetical protein